MAIFIKNAQIVTQNKERKIIKNGAILVVGDKIADLGPSISLEKKYARFKKRTINGQGKVVIPGLINAHTHAAMTLLRGFADDLPLQQWLAKKIWPAEAKLKPSDIYQGTKLAAEEMIKSGTTTVNNMYWQPQEEIKAIRQSGMRGFISITVIDVGVLNIKPLLIEKTYSELKKKAGKLVKLTLAPHAIYTVSEETLRWCGQFADKNNLLLHIHLSETEQEVKNCLAYRQCRPVEYLEKIGFLGDNVIVAHCCWLSDREIKILAKREVSVAHCPTSNLKLASGVMPLGKLLKAGVNVALGTDGPASNNSLDMFSEMKIAALIHKWDERNPTASDAQTILDMATINGAKALAMQDNIGSIDIDREADIIIVNFTKPHLRPCFNPVSHLVYAANGADVSTVIIGGKVLFKK